MSEFVLMRSLDELPSAVSVAVYGKGSQGRDLVLLLKEQRPDVSVICFIDSYEPGTCDGLDVVTPQDLLPDLPEVILVASYYADEIMKAMPGAMRGKSVVIDRELVARFNRDRGVEPRFSIISLELTTYCNMACEFCAHDSCDRRNNHMDMDFFKEIVSQISKDTISRTVMLTVLGEPLLHPQLDAAVAEVAKQGLYPQVCTNGLLLDAKRYQRLLDNGLSLIQISIHDLTPATFAKYRKPHGSMTYEEYMEQIMGVIDLHMRTDPDCRLELVLTAMRSKDPLSILWNMPEYVDQGEHWFEYFSSFWAAMEGLAGKAGYPLILSRKDLSELYNGVHALEQRLRFSLDIGKNMGVLFGPIYADFRDIMLKIRPAECEKMTFTPLKSGVCEVARQPSVSYDGEVYPCCTIPYARKHRESLCLGRVDAEHSLLSLFTGKKGRRFFDGMEKGQLSRYCSTCLGRYVV